jgi:hypothetical protein
MTIMTIKVSYGMKHYEYEYYAWGYLEPTQNLGDMPMPKVQQQHN